MAQERQKPNLQALDYSGTFPPPPSAAMAAKGAQDRASLMRSGRGYCSEI
jgi:hypothetical protein